MNKENSTKEKQDTTPVTLTPSAIVKIRAMMAKDDKKESALRVGVITGGCAGLSYELRFQKNPYENDIVIVQDGITLLINPDNLVFLRGTVIDYIDTLKESGFQYRNPNAQNSCGCGISFS